MDLNWVCIQDTESLDCSDGIGSPWVQVQLACPGCQHVNVEYWMPRVLSVDMFPNMALLHPQACLPHSPSRNQPTITYIAYQPSVLIRHPLLLDPRPLALPLTHSSLDSRVWYTILFIIHLSILAWNQKQWQRLLHMQRVGESTCLTKIWFT